MTSLVAPYVSHIATGHSGHLTYDQLSIITEHMFTQTLRVLFMDFQWK